MHISVVLSLALVLGATLVVASERFSELNLVLQHQNEMVEFLAKAIHSADAVSPEHIDDCFAYYQPEQNAIIEKYKEELVVCEDTAKEAKESLSEQSAIKKTELLGRGEGACSSLSSCESEEDGLEFFKCYNEQTKTHYQTIYSLSVDSEQVMTYLQTEYQRVDDAKKSCDVTARNTYIADMASCNSDFQACLEGADVPGTTTPVPDTTTTPSGDTTTTEAPDTTTTAPQDTTTTAAPDTTTTAPDTTTTPSGDTTTTEAPDTTTTTVPQDTTTTAAPDTTTTAPQDTTTTAAPDTTTTAPDTTTTPSGDTTTTEDPDTTTTENESPSPEEDLDPKVLRRIGRFGLWNTLRRN